MRLENYIDHTLLRPDATVADIEKLCGEAVRYQLYAVCVQGCHLATCKKALWGTGVRLVTVVGFPNGANLTETKCFEAERATALGADEIDMVMNIGWMKSGEHGLVEAEIKKVKKTIGDKVLKVILETCYLNGSEKRHACEMAIRAGADFVKTSTGFGPMGATFEEVASIKKWVGEAIKIKASGGIKDAETAKRYISLGASRIGTSSGAAMMATLQ
jgi:deoxyribose-phosphate aldolase